MSRAERRQYQRMMKGQDPYAQQPRGGQKRPPKKRATPEPRDWSFNRGFWLKSVAVAVVVGLVGLSVVWSNGAETALLVGALAAAATMGLLVMVRLFFQRRAPAG
jgi:hypothetical protein